jgi:uncharacterized protein (TIGR02646 family)
MKYIQKQIANEPDALRRYRTTTEKATYDGYVDKDVLTNEEKPLKNALLKEQGYLCAYCMGRISLDLNKQYKPKVEVEHFQSQELFPALDLSYNNFLGVCNGASVTYPENEKVHHCDKTKGEYGKMNGQVQLRKLDPRNSTCEQLLGYTNNGEILSLNDDTDVTWDINEVLNLNNKALKDARRGIIDNAREKMIREKPAQQWNKAFLMKHLEEWQTMANGQFRIYCMAAVWFINSLLSKPQYSR